MYGRNIRPYRASREAIQRVPRASRLQGGRNGNTMARSDVSVGVLIAVHPVYPPPPLFVLVSDIYITIAHPT